jgi:hypothetical protein
MRRLNQSIGLRDWLPSSTSVDGGGESYNEPVEASPAFKEMKVKKKIKINKQINKHTKHRKAKDEYSAKSSKKYQTKSWNPSQGSGSSIGGPEKCTAFASVIRDGRRNQSNPFDAVSP